MTIATSSEQIAVRDSIASWARSTSVTDIVRSDLDKPSDQWTGLFSQIADLGVFAAAVPEASDGLGASFLDVAAMLEQCGVDLVPGPLGPTVTAAIALAVRRSDSAQGDDDPGAALLA